MIVVDTSAIVAIGLRESDGQLLIERLTRSASACMSAVNAHETAVVLMRRHGSTALELTWELLLSFGVGIVPFDDAQARMAAAAYRRYGKGIDPKARLNLADCAAYALARPWMRRSCSRAAISRRRMSDPAFEDRSGKAGPCSP